MRTPFWISHHSDDQLFRCVSIFGLHVCARCLGLYPLFFILLSAQAVIRGPELHILDVLVMISGTLPALFDWGRAQFNPKSGSNGLRITTGILLAFPLSRSIWFHASQPFHPLAMAHLAWIAAAACLILAASRMTAFCHQSKNAPEKNAPMPLTSEEILAGLSMSDVQERYGLPKISQENAAPAELEKSLQTENTASCLPIIVSNGGENLSGQQAGDPEKNSQPRHSGFS